MKELVLPAFGGVMALKITYLVVVGALPWFDALDASLIVAVCIQALRK